MYVINYVLPKGEDQMGTNPSPEILKKYKKNWPSHNIELLGMKEWLCVQFMRECSQGRRFKPKSAFLLVIQYVRFRKSPGDHRDAAFGQIPAAYVQFMRECSHNIRFKPQWLCITQVQGVGRRAADCTRLISLLVLLKLKYTESSF
jgi:hypothetical protein